jgi:hypothetical protein
MSSKITYTVVTSFGVKGYEDYGKRFLDAFRKYWPENIRLLVYHEGSVLPEWCHSLDLREVGSCASFLARHRNSLVAQGKEPKPGFRWKKSALEAGYNFRFDAYKFCRKVFALYDASTISDGKMFWLDADTITFREVPLKLLDMCLPDTFDVSYLSRRKNYHSECGFVGYNLYSNKTRRFLDTFASLYDTDAVFDLKEWHDSYVFDRVVEAHDLTSYHIPNVTINDVFNSSLIGQYMYHYKGDRKYQLEGFSRVFEQNRKRYERIWKELGA